MKLDSIFSNDPKLNESILHEMKVAKSPIDIGHGFYVRKIGFDRNGNWSYWVQRGNNQAKKIQALNVNAGSNKITNLSEFLDPNYKDTVTAIKKYYVKYLDKSARHHLGESQNMDFSNVNFTKADELAYVVSNIQYNGKAYNNAGLLVLESDPEDFLLELAQKVDGEVESVDDIKSDPSNIKLKGVEDNNRAIVEYTLDVYYTDGEGNKKRVDLTFNEATFKLSSTLE